MLKVNCSSSDTTKLTSLVPFQGGLKKRKKEDIDALINSLRDEGMMMPFAVWETEENKKYILDGHGRLEALIRMSLEDSSILEQDFPCIYIKASSEEEARKSLLQITSIYGKFNKKGVLSFSATIPEYKAPVVSFAKHTIHRKRFDKKENAFARIVIKVPLEKEADLRRVLSEAPGIEVIN